MPEIVPSELGKSDLRISGRRPSKASCRRASSVLADRIRPFLAESRTPPALGVSEWIPGVVLARLRTRRQAARFVNRSRQFLHAAFLLVNLHRLI